MTDITMLYVPSFRIIRHVFQAVQEINYSKHGVRVKTMDGWLYKADYVMVSVSLGVLQSNLISFMPPLPVSS
jgi:monoamine oxidase